MNENRRRRVAIITGSRADFGLLTPVLRAVQASSMLEPQVIACGSHLVGAAPTLSDVQREIAPAAIVEMQREGDSGRMQDAEALGRGIEGIARALRTLRPDWALVLGDRIEAFAGACAASVGGVALAHIHGGDRAEGVADEAMRHAITKLAHLHLAATELSAARIIRMGEDPRHVHVVGSPAIDGLADVKPLTDEAYRGLGRPLLVLLHHPAGLPEAQERALARHTVAGVARFLDGRPALALRPNLDPGRNLVLEEMEMGARAHGWQTRDHLARPEFLSLLARLALEGGALVGSSSAGLIECAALGVPAVNVGPRQSGRERPDNVFDACGDSDVEVATVIRSAVAGDRSRWRHPYGDGSSAGAIARLLETVDADDQTMLRKRCSY